MRLKTWSWSVIETKERHWSVWYRWVLGWARHLLHGRGLHAVPPPDRKNVTR